MKKFDLLEIDKVNNHLFLKLFIICSTPQIYNFSVPLKSDHEIELKHIMSLNNSKLIGKWISERYLYHKKLIEKLFSSNVPLILFTQKIGNIPLELAFHDNVCLSLNRVVSRSFLSISENNLKKNNNNKMLIIADPLSNLQYAYEEAYYIYKTLQNNHRFLNIDFLHKEIDPIEFITYLNNYQWIYFAGHGDYSDKDGSTLKIHPKLRLNQNHLSLIESAPELIFLNACSIAKTSHFKPFSFIANLLDKGVYNVISSQDLIPEQSYSSFVFDFYDYLFTNKSVGDSMLKTKMKNFKEGKNDWIYFQLFGLPFYRLTQNE